MDAAWRVVLSHTGLQRKIAGLQCEIAGRRNKLDLMDFKEPLAEIAQEVFFGCLLGETRFDPAYGVKFCTFAGNRAKHRVRDAALKEIERRKHTPHTLDVQPDDGEQPEGDDKPRASLADKLAKRDWKDAGDERDTADALQAALDGGLEALSPVERRIVEAFAAGVTVGALATLHGLSCAGVQQIHVRALAKLREMELTC